MSIAWSVLLGGSYTAYPPDISAHIEAQFQAGDVRHHRSVPDCQCTFALPLQLTPLLPFPLPPTRMHRMRRWSRYVVHSTSFPFIQLRGCSKFWHRTVQGFVA